MFPEIYETSPMHADLEKVVNCPQAENLELYKQQCIREILELNQKVLTDQSNLKVQKDYIDS